MKIGIDFDGVMTDVGQQKAKMIWDLYEESVPKQYTNRSEVVRYITEEQYNPVAEATGTFENTINCPMLLHADIMIPRLAENNELYLVTAREPHKLPQVKQWLKNHNLYHHFESITSSKDYYTSKAEICERYGIELFIDDDERHLKDMKCNTYHMKEDWCMFMLDKTINEAVNELYDGFIVRAKRYSDNNYNLLVMLY